MAAACQLYQLESKHQLSTGAYVAVNGPWDRFGVVQKSERQANGRYLNLIRGCPQKSGQKVVASF